MYIVYIPAQKLRFIKLLVGGTMFASLTIDTVSSSSHETRNHRTVNKQLRLTIIKRLCGFPQLFLT